MDRAKLLMVTLALSVTLSGCSAAYLRTDKSVDPESSCEDIRIEFAITEKNRKRAENVLRAREDSWTRRMMFWETMRARSVVDNAERRKHELALMYQQKGC